MHPNDGRVVSNFIIQVPKNEDITIYGFVRLMPPDKFTGPVTLGYPVEFSIKELAVLIKETRA